MKSKEPVEGICMAMTALVLVLTPTSANAGMPVDQVMADRPPCFLHVFSQVFGVHHAMVSCNAGSTRPILTQPNTVEVNTISIVARK